MTNEERKAVRAAQAAVRARDPGWKDLTMLLLLTHGCGPPQMVRDARRRLVWWGPRSGSVGSDLPREV